MEAERNTFEELNEDDIKGLLGEPILDIPIITDTNYFNNRLSKDLIDHPELNDILNKAVEDFVNREFNYYNPPKLKMYNPFIDKTIDDFLISVDNFGVPISKTIIDEKEYSITDILIPEVSYGNRFKVAYRYLKRLFNL